MRLFDSASIGQALWFLVTVGWMFLLLLGLEADKPLSGDLPGGADHHATHLDHDWDNVDRMGETLGWALFATISVFLVVVLYWMLAAHH